MPRKRRSSASEPAENLSSGSKPARSTQKTSVTKKPTIAKIPEPKPAPPDKQNPLIERPKTSPDLFTNHKATQMASAIPIWEASNILTQRKHLPWGHDSEGKLSYAKDINDGQGAIHFWVTENLEDEHPATLAGAAALAVIDTFDIRAACMHLIYAAHAAQLDRPWEQELVIDDRQIEAYLGLKKRTDKNRREKLALIEEIAKQPCKITTFISWAAQGKVKGFTLEEGRLWHMLGTRYHYQQDLFGNQELAGITFIVKPGLWTRYFLNEEGRRDRIAYSQRGALPQHLLECVMSVWQHREGAARLMVWLLFKTQFNKRSPLLVETLMEVAYGSEKVQQARDSSTSRKKLASTWDEDLLTLHDRGWTVQFDAETYPCEIRPAGFGRDDAQRPRGFFEQLLVAQLWITPSEEWSQSAIALEPEDTIVPPSDLEASPKLTGDTVRNLRQKQGWSQRKLATLTKISQGLISLIENGERSITPENEALLNQVFNL